MDRRDVPVAALLLTAVGQAVLDQGGFRPGGRVIFGVLGALALAAAIVADRSAAARFCRLPITVVLWLLAGFGALSAAWSVGLVGDAVRWGLVSFGYGAVGVAAAVLTRRGDRVTALAAALAAIAAISAVIGLGGAISHSGPFADYVRGSWRPGGTLEYADAMALLAVSALPVALTGMCAARRWVSAPATAAAMAFASVLALDLTRLELVLAVLLIAAAILRPERTVRSSRGRAAGAALALGVVAVGVHAIAGATVAERATPHVLREVIQLGLVWGVVGVAWGLGTARARQMDGAMAVSGSRAVVTPRRALVVGVAAVVVAVVLVAGGGHGPRYVAHVGGGGFWHGRVRIWRIAIDTAEQRPLAGHGADSFLAATIVAQHSSPVAFAHDLPLELAVELGLPGLLLALALYATAARIVWRARRSAAGWLLAPAAGGFLLASLVDWPWHLAGSGAVWAAAVGGLAGSQHSLHTNTPAAADTR